MVIKRLSSKREHKNRGDNRIFRYQLPQKYCAWLVHFSMRYDVPGLTRPLSPGMNNQFFGQRWKGSKLVSMGKGVFKFRRTTITGIGS